MFNNQNVKRLLLEYLHVIQDTMSNILRPIISRNGTNPKKNYKEYMFICMLKVS